jgi:diguanylate cyclase (GGDEF)-like protein
MGFDIEGREGGLYVNAVLEGRPAEAAGFRPGDRIVEANGIPVAHWAEYMRVASGYARGQTVEFLVEREGRRLVLTGRPGIPFPWAAYAGNLVIVLGYFALGLLALFQPVSNLSKRLLYLFAFAIALEFALPTGRVGSDWGQYAIDVAFYLLSGFQCALELHLVLRVPGKHPWLRRFPWGVGAVYTLGLGTMGFLCLAYTADFFGWSLPFLTDANLARILNYALLPLWSVLLLLLLAVQAAGYPEPAGRHQAGFMLLGTLPWVLLVAYTTALAVAGRPQPGWLDVGWAVAIFPFPVAVFIGMYRAHLLDLQLIVRKGMLYSALTGGLLLIFYAALGAGSFLLTRTLFGGQPSVWLVAGAALLLGLLVQPLRQSLQAFIDRRFFPERTALRARLLGLVRELPVHGNLVRMGERLAARLREDFGVGRVLVLTGRQRAGALEVLGFAGEGGPPDLPVPVPPDDEALLALTRARRTVPAERLTLLTGGLPGLLRREGAALAVPLMAEGVLVGLVLMGPKSGRERFRAEETEMLDFVASHVAVVFENARLYASATFDPLTGVLRREAALERLEQEIHRALRYGRPLAVAMADLDRFKAVNDAYGHLAGDQVLIQVAAALQQGLRGSDFLGRFGGDEFLLVFPETPVPQALEVADRIRENLGSREIPLPGGQRVRLTISLGLAGLQGMDTDEASLTGTLLHEADNALYEAKHQGRDRVRTAGA